MRCRWLLTILMLSLGLSQAAAQAPIRDEVRVIVDVSGSMKQTDPQNLRAPAVRLLVNLLPGNARSGLWYFAQNVNNPVPAAGVSGDWRRQALAAADRIHSRGLLTDIGAALTTATADWREPDSATRRSLILLTDGQVDLGRDPARNAAARQRILEEILPQLRQLDVKVHAIALSDQADSALLEALAAGSDGSFARTDSAEELQRLFLRMFEQSVQRDAVPLNGNRFQVDASIRELTLLAFRKPGGEAARLKAPDGREFGADAVPTGVRWHREAGYDLVTISQPAPGEWLLLGETDPDNRVMIVTDLQLKVSALPNNLFGGESVPLTVELLEQDVTVTRTDFLSLLQVKVSQESAGAPARQWQLADSGVGDDAVGGDGVFTLALGPTLSPGEHALVVDVDGRTFRRQHRQRVRVYDSPVSVSASPLDDGQLLVLTQTVDWVDPASMAIGARLQRRDGSASQLTVPATAPGEWRLALTGADATDTRVELEAAGRTTHGRAFNVKLPPLEFAPASAPDPTPVPEATAEVNWLFVGAVLVTANIALLTLIGLIIHLLRQRRGRTPGFGDDKPEEPKPEAEA